jgi:hypothetical protein
LSGRFDLDIRPGGRHNFTGPCDPPPSPCTLAPLIREVDALSYGRDAARRIGFYFSVNQAATGVAGTAPDVASEGAAGYQEAAADVFQYLGPVPDPGTGTVYGNVAVVDGDANAPSGAFGIGLEEPIPPAPVAWQNQGDALDALDMDTRARHLDGPIYVSLKGDHWDYPVEGYTDLGGGAYCLWRDTACVNGYYHSGGAWSGADILVWTPTTGLTLWADAAMLGLTDFEDEIDALAIWEDGDGQPDPGPGGDRILFSVRRGSALVGQLDSRLGREIGQGDILEVCPGTLPAIVVTAEALGLSFSSPRDYWDDDLDALDTYHKAVAAGLCGGDMDCDGDVDFDDIWLFVIAIGDDGSNWAAAYEAAFGATPPCEFLNGDLDGNRRVDFDDITGFVGAIPSDCAD